MRWYLVPFAILGIGMFWVPLGFATAYALGCYHPTDEAAMRGFASMVVGCILCAAVQYAHNGGSQ